MDVDVDVQHTLMRLQQFQNGQYAVIHVAKSGSLALGKA